IPRLLFWSRPTIGRTALRKAFQQAWIPSGPERAARRQGKSSRRVRLQRPHVLGQGGQHAFLWTSLRVIRLGSDGVIGRDDCGAGSRISAVALVTGFLVKACQLIANSRAALSLILASALTDNSRCSSASLERPVARRTRKRARCGNIAPGSMRTSVRAWG